MPVYMTIFLNMHPLRGNILYESRQFRFFAKNLKRPYFSKGTPNYGTGYHKALTYANA